MGYLSILKLTKMTVRLQDALGRRRCVFRTHWKDDVLCN